MPKEKKTTRKLTILRMIAIVLREKNEQKYTHFEEKNDTEGFSLKKMILTVLTHVKLML